MKTPLQRIRTGAIVAFAIFVVAVFGYRILGYRWVDSLWMVVITMSSVGYGEHSTVSDATKVFSVLVILVGMSAAVYTIGGFLQLMTEGEIERVLGHRRMSRDIKRLKDHVIICGYGRTGEILAKELSSMDRSFVVVDFDSERIVDAQSDGILTVNGDATEEQVLMDAGVEEAFALVIGLPSDAANVFITLTSRNLNAGLQIIARGEHRSTEKKLKQAGADRVVMPAIVGAHQMARLITRPSTADLMDLVTERSFHDLELDEFAVPASSLLVGATVMETEAHRKHRLLVVAVKETTGNMVLNPDANYVFKIGDVMILMGHAEDIARFRFSFGL